MIKDMRKYIEQNTMPIPFSGCWVWLGALLPKKYGHSAFGRTHRIAWEAYKGAIPRGLWVLHRCDVPSCCNPDHLFLGTNKDNVADKVRKGRAKTKPQRGQTNGFAKLSDEMVKHIRQSCLSNRALAKELNVSRPTVSRARRGLSWGHV